MTSFIQQVELKAMTKIEEEANIMSNNIKKTIFGRVFLPSNGFVFLTFLCSSCAVCISSLAELEQGGGGSCFLLVSLSFDLAEHSEMRTEPTQYCTPWMLGHSPFVKLARNVWSNL